ncbi:MAG: ABC transporter substrate-binding protein [Thiovulaceae bacterium]|nr:ABC transporter substrate-binding protein [Sulfurimonadaceae bacterium]
MKKIILVLSLSISLFATQKVILQLDWLNQFQFAGYYMAKELGYYRDAGLDVEIKEFTKDTDIFSVIPEKKADFAVGHSSIIISQINGADIVALGAIYQQSPMILLTRDDTNISTVADLKNKKIMLSNDAQDMASLMAMLSSRGIALKDVKLIPHSFDLDDLVDQKTDAMASYISNEPIRMEDKGIGYKIFNPKDYGFHFYDDILFTSSAYIKNNPQTTKDFYEATMRGWTYAFDNITQSAEIIYKYYNTQHKTLIQLIKEGEVLKHLACKKDIPLGYLNKDQLSDIVKVYKVFGMTSKDLDYDSFIYEYNHPKELAFKLYYKDIVYIVFIFILAIVSFIFILLFISLKKKWIHTKNQLKQIIAHQKEEIDNQNRVIMIQSKIAALGEMLSNIAHQWRQPLNIISLYTAKLETSLLFGASIQKEDILKISNDINIQAQYLSQTIDDFKNYFSSDMESSAHFYIADAIDRVHELIKESFKSNNISIVLSTQDCRVLSNENLLIQALLNIYNNAKDAMVEKQEKDRYLFVDIKCNAKELMITLKDSGGGIKEEILEKIFEPYFTTKHKSKGTGLGLYITYIIITQHLHGTISARTREYNYMNIRLIGAEFVITLPIS